MKLIFRIYSIIQKLFEKEFALKIIILETDYLLFSPNE